MPPSPTYQSFLLRFWRATPHSNWQASLQCTATDAQFTFRELAELFDFLATRMRMGEGVTVITDEEPRNDNA